MVHISIFQVRAIRAGSTSFGFYQDDGLDNIE